MQGAGARAEFASRLSLKEPQAVEAPIQDLAPLRPLQTQPRAQGAVRLSVKARDGLTAIDRLHQQGSLKVLFPRTGTRGLTAVLLNTAGGITGGDRFDTRMTAQPGTRLTVTTQAAERVYRAQDGAGRVCAGIRVQEGAHLSWLPQETLLYDHGALRRSLDIRLAPASSCLLVESLVFGRTAMGETVQDLTLEDRITLFREDKMVFADRTRLCGDTTHHLRRAATGQTAGAMASVVYAASDAQDRLDPVREMLPDTAGVSLPAQDILFCRILAKDGYALRATLLPVIALLNTDPLPRPWMI